MTKDDPFRGELIAALPKLRRFALTLTRNGADADDLVQAACARALEQMGRFQIGAKLEPWLYTMVRNIWISEMRKQKVRVGQGQVVAADTPELVTQIGGHAVTYGNQIMDAVMSLPEGLSSVLLLVSVEGRSYRETANILDIPIGTVMSRVSGGRQRLRALLQEEA